MLSEVQQTEAFLHVTKAISLMPMIHVQHIIKSLPLENIMVTSHCKKVTYIYNLPKFDKFPELDSVDLQMYSYSLYSKDKWKEKIMS